MDQKQYTTKTTQTKTLQEGPIPFHQKENLTDRINLSGPPDIDSKYTMNQVFNLHDPLDTISLSKLEIDNIFSAKHRKINTSIIDQTNQSRYHNSRKKTLLSFFRKFINTSITENTDILEYQTIDLKVPCLSSTMILLAFHISYSFIIKH